AKLKIQQSVIRARVRTYRMQGGVGGDGAGAKVWYGLRPIPFSRLRPRETPSGVVTAGGLRADGAFIANLRGRKQVLRRRGAARVPLEVVMADVSDAANIYIEDELVGTAESDRQFFKLLEHEL